MHDMRQTGWYAQCNKCPICFFPFFHHVFGFILKASSFSPSSCLHASFRLASISRSSVLVSTKNNSQLHIPPRKKNQSSRQAYSQAIINLQAKIRLSSHDTQSVGVAETTPPALDADDSVALLEHTELESVADAPLETLVDILLPGDGLEVGLLLVVVEGVDAAVQVGVARGDGVAGDHDDGADGAVLGDEAGGVAAEIIR
jgi:hypothetical protein